MRVDGIARWYRDGSCAATDAAAHASPITAAVRATAREALATLGDGPVQPTGAVSDALAAGRLMGSDASASLDAAERALRGAEQLAHVRRLTDNGNMNPTGVDHVRMRLAVSDGEHELDVVRRAAHAQAPQDELMWRTAREWSTDHLFLPTARVADGSSRSPFVHGMSLAEARVTDADALDEQLAAAYLADPQLGLSPREAAQAARLDRSAFQLQDYVWANPDRSGANGRVDAVRGTVHGIDAGLLGEGVRARGASVLVPGLWRLQGGVDGGSVRLEPALVEFLRARTSPERLLQLHDEVWSAPGIAAPSSSVNDAVMGRARGVATAQGAAERLAHALATGGYEHVARHGAMPGALRPSTPMSAHVSGLAGIRGGIANGMGAW